MTDDAAGQVVELAWGRVWELVTADERIVIDVSRGKGGVKRWMRLPTRRDDGTITAAPADGRWQRLAAVSPADHVFSNDDDGAGMLRRVQAGEPATVWSGYGTSWVTSPVVSVRELADDEVPGEGRRRA